MKTRRRTDVTTDKKMNRQRADTMGMQRLYPNTSLHEILQIAGLPTDNLPDDDVYVTAMPTTRAEAMELLDGYHGIKWRS
jgi:hypothetical protein